MMPGRLLNILSKLLVVIFSLVLVYALVVMMINLKDQPPSATAIEFQQSWNNRKPVDATENGYLYLLGFDVEKNADPKTVGAERVKWTKEAIHLTTEGFMSFPQPHNDFQKQIPQGVKKILDLCGQITKDCINSIDNQHELINQWGKNEAWIIDRYQQLIAYEAWLELADLDVRLPFANYGDVMKVQRLAFIHAFSAVPTDDGASITELLEKDLSFWRTVLKDTDMLIGKMIAVAAIKNNFLWTNYFLLKQKSNAKSGVVFATLNRPFTDEELSMRRCLIGEWIFAQSIVAPLDGSGIDNITGKFLIKFVYQKQDALNNRAAALNSIVVELDVPLVNFEETLETYQQKYRPEKTLIHYFLHPYNIAGQIMGDVAPPSLYTDYVVRTKDLEVFRRGLLFSIEQMKFSADESAHHLSPYPSKPFVLNEKQRSVTVTGLGKDARSQQIYFY